jgi:hypothetical protein
MVNGLAEKDLQLVRVLPPIMFSVFATLPYQLGLTPNLAFCLTATSQKIPNGRSVSLAAFAPLFHV